MISSRASRFGLFVGLMMLASMATSRERAQIPSPNDTLESTEVSSDHSLGITV
jgi:hypothetical protein